MATRLKSLELHGYKTFASSTVFELSDSVTAIVGPNGSGKSNVADSIRWALGEQSYSLLRGKKTEDMIFSGSEHRPRAGMASVTITFDNEDGWLPIDFSEVSIARRAYRDGQNEYLLNGQKVRLKEISELLAQSGLAERTYTIIGQGLVDAALSLKPEERRKFFEEAAGIGLYRRRREESVSRLETTQRNLDRVLDILSEIEPRLKSLERQAIRVQEYERIKSDLQVLLREWYGYHWHRNQRDLRHAQEVYRVQEENLEKARLRQLEVEKLVESRRGEIQQLREKLNQWHAQSSEIHQSYENISRNLAVMDERKASFIEQQQSLESDLLQLDDVKTNMEERIQVAREDKERLNEDLQDALNQVKTARQNLQQRQTERNEIERSLKNIRSSLISAETRQVQLKARLEEMNGRLSSQQNSHDTHIATIEREKQSIQKAREMVDDLVSESDQASLQKKDIENQLSALKDKIKQVENQRKDAQKEKDSLEVEKTRLKAQLEVLDQAENSLSGLNQGAKYIIQAAKKGKLKGKYQTINRMLEVPADYETAIAAILGEHLDGVIVDQLEDPEEVLSLLESGNNGRTVLYPVHNFQSQKTKDITTSADCIGRAIDLIKAPESLQSILDVLLGNVFLVKERKAAQNLVSSLPEHACAVTLLGEIFWGNGIVIAGKDGREGVIGRPRRRRELKEAITSIDTQLDIVENTLADFDETYNEYNIKANDTEAVLRKENQKLNEVNHSLQKAEMEYEQAQKRNQWQKNQLDNLEKDIDHTKTEIENITVEISEKTKEIQDHQENLKEFSRKLNHLPLEDFQNEESHWNLNAAVAERALKDAEKHFNEYYHQRENNKNQQKNLIERLENNKVALQQLETESFSQREKEKELKESIKELQNKIDPAEQDLAAIENDYNQVQDNYTAVQQGVSVAERNSAQSQLELTRTRESIESLRRRIEEDFGLVAFEYEDEVSGPTPLPLEGMVEQLPVVKELSPEIEDGISRQRAQIRRIGSINPDAQTEFEEVQERAIFLKTQMEDLQLAIEDLKKVIAELDELMRQEFKKTFDAVATEFKKLFTHLFGGGSARLILTDEEHPTETGIDIEARLPGKREQGLALLSGGERSLTAVALVFSLLKVSPTPFCVLDEVDAMLDESNVGRFCELLRDLGETTQFIVVTHNRSTVQVSNVIYGITMGRDSTSKVISLRLDEVDDDMVK